MMLTLSITINHCVVMNEPAHVTQVAAMLARIHGISVEEVARRTGDNFCRLFRP